MPMPLHTTCIGMVKLKPRRGRKRLPWNFPGKERRGGLRTSLGRSAGSWIGGFKRHNA